MTKHNKNALSSLHVIKWKVYRPSESFPCHSFILLIIAASEVFASRCDSPKGSSFGNGNTEKAEHVA